MYQEIADEVNRILNYPENAPEIEVDDVARVLVYGSSLFVTEREQQTIEVVALAFKN